MINIRVLLCLFTLFFAEAARADIKLADIFGDHMVLQEGIKVPIWGTGEPGDKITVTFGIATILRSEFSMSAATASPHACATPTSPGLHAAARH